MEKQLTAFEILSEFAGFTLNHAKKRGKSIDTESYFNDLSLVTEALQYSIDINDLRAKVNNHKKNSPVKARKAAEIFLTDVDRRIRKTPREVQLASFRLAEFFKGEFGLWALSRPPKILKSGGGFEIIYGL